MPEVNEAEIKEAIRSLLIAIGEDPEREGLLNTPKRVAGFWKEFIEYQQGNLDVTFEAISTDQMVVVKDIQGWSLCEHHLLPFSFTAHVGYITNKKVIGKMKDGTAGVAISEFVGLRSKMYSLRYGNEEKKTAKGITKCVIKKELKHQLFKDCLFNQTLYRNKIKMLYSLVVDKISLSSYDDKRYVLENGQNTTAHGPRWSSG